MVKLYTGQNLRVTKCVQNVNYFSPPVLVSKIAVPVARHIGSTLVPHEDCDRCHKKKHSIYVKFLIVLHFAPSDLTV